MPTYEFACRNGHRIEVFQRIDEAPPTVCEVCGAALRKVFHPAGILFKGSGFYATDSRSKAGAGKGAGDGSKKADGPPSGDGAASETSTSSKEGAAASWGSGSSKDQKKDAKTDGKKAPRETSA